MHIDSLCVVSTRRLERRTATERKIGWIDLMCSVVLVVCMLGHCIIIGQRISNPFFLTFAGFCYAQHVDEKANGPFISIPEKLLCGVVVVVVARMGSHFISPE